MPDPLEIQNTRPSAVPRAAEIRSYLSRLLAGPIFSAASRRGQLLQHLVNHTLDGDADQVSEYAIGLDVFQKPQSFDPRIESVVRTEVSRLRQRLKDYYADEGRNDPIVIDFPPRSYVASFTFPDRNAARAEDSAAQAVATGATQASPRRVNWLLPAVAIVALALALSAGAYDLWRSRSAASAAKSQLNAIVVLPFENYSANGADQYLPDGLTEEITNDLAEWRDLRVVARTSAFAFKGKNEDVRKIGQELNVDAVLEGSFTKQGDRVRITAQLNRTSDGYHLWSHAYEVQSSDLMSVQDDVAGAISTTIRQIRGGTPPALHIATENPEAHDLYLQGIYQLNLRTPASIKQAISLFQSAADLDPKFARAYLGIATAEIGAVSITVESPAEGGSKALAAARKAIDLDPNLGEAHGILGSSLMLMNWDWNDADAEYRRALELGAGADTQARYAWGLAARGRFAESHEHFRIARELDPLSIIPLFDEFFTYNFEHDFAGADRDLQALEQLNPNFIGGHALRELNYVEQHRCDDAAPELAWVMQKYPSSSLAKFMSVLLAVCRGDRAAALRGMNEMAHWKGPDFASPYQLAIGYAMLHDKDNAIAQLQVSMDRHEGQVMYLKYDPAFDEIRSDPRYVAIEKRVGLVN